MAFTFDINEYQAAINSAAPPPTPGVVQIPPPSVPAGPINPATGGSWAPPPVNVMAPEPPVFQYVSGPIDMSVLSQPMTPQYEDRPPDWTYANWQPTYEPTQLLGPHYMNPATSPYYQAPYTGATAEYPLAPPPGEQAWMEQPDMRYWNYDQVQMMVDPDLIYNQTPIPPQEGVPYGERWGPPDLTVSPKADMMYQVTPSVHGDELGWDYYNLDPEAAKQNLAYRKLAEYYSPQNLKEKGAMAGAEWRVQSILGQAMDRIYGHAGEGKYEAWRPWHNLGQLRIEGLDEKLGGAGSALQPGRIASALGWGAWILFTAGSSGLEQIFGHNYYNSEFMPLKSSLGVDRQPNGEAAWRAAMTVAYSGPEAVANAYHDALYLANNNLLSEENLELLEAKHGKLVNEIVGHMALDPAWMLDVASLGTSAAKSSRVLRWTKGAENSFVKPLLKADGTLMPGSEVTSMLTKGAHRAEQVKAVPLEGGGAIYNMARRTIDTLLPRLKNTYTHIQATLSAQFTETAAGVVQQAAKMDAVAAGIAKDAPDYIKFIDAQSSKRMQDWAALMVQTATDDQTQLYNAMQELDKLGFRGAASKVGRQTGVLLKQLMMKPNGELGDIHQIIQFTHEKGGTAADVAAEIYTKFDDILRKIVEIPKHDPEYPVNTWNIGQKIVRKFPVVGLDTKFRRAADETYAALLLGLNPGYAMRNLYDNMAHTIANGLSPFGTNEEFWKHMGYTPIVRSRGIGQIGEKIRTKMPGTMAAEAGEKWFSKVNYDKVYVDTLNKTLEAALDSLTEFIEPQYLDMIRPRFYRGWDSLEKLAQREVLIDNWKELPTSYIEAMKKVNPDMPHIVMDTLEKAETIEDAFASIQGLMGDATKHLRVNTEAAKDIGTVVGTLNGQAMAAMSNSKMFKVSDLGSLSRLLAGRETAIDLSRNRAFVAAANSINPRDTFAFMKVVEDRYAQAIKAIQERQAVGYLKMINEEITPKKFISFLDELYRDEYTKLDKAYSEIIHTETGRETLEELTGKNAKRILHWALNREAVKYGETAADVKRLDKTIPITEYLKGHSQVEDMIARPSVHFRNKVRKIMLENNIYPPDVKNPAAYVKSVKVKDLNTDELLDVINAFRRENALPGAEIGEIETDLMQLASEYNNIITTSDAAKQHPLVHLFMDADIGYPDSIVQPGMSIEEIQVAGEQGMAALRKLLRWQLRREALLSGWTPGAVNDFAAHADDLITSPAFINVIDDALSAGIPKGMEGSWKGMDHIGSIDDLDEYELRTVINYLRQQMGQAPLEFEDIINKYAAVPTKGLYDDYTKGLHGILPVEEDLQYIDNIIATTTDKEKLEAAIAARTAIMSKPAPSPSLATSSFEQAAREIEMLDGIIEWLNNNSGTRLTEGIPEPLMQHIRGAWVDAHNISGEVAKRARNQTLLDYRDRRTIDPILKFIYPWHYWWSRSVPNWLQTMATNPRLSAQFMRMKQQVVDYNSTDPDIPEWGKDMLNISVPGYPGKLLWDYSAAFNAVSTIFDNFEDEDQQKDLLGKLIQSTEGFGPAPHPMLLAAYAAERWFLHRDEAAARSLGYLTPATRVFAAVTGKTVEPWLWITDADGQRIPWTGGTKWDLEKTTRFMASKQKAGEMKAEDALLGAALKYGPEYEEVLSSDIVGGYRTLPVIASSIFGFRITPRQDWENDMVNDSQLYNEAKNRSDEEARKVLAEKPWLSTLWMSWDNEAARMYFLAKNVIYRVPPMPAKDRDELFNSVGITADMLERFGSESKEEKKITLEDWEPRDYDTFVSGIIDLAEMFAVPDVKSAKEWAIARQERQAIWEQVAKKFPSGENDNDIYWLLKETQGDEAANKFAEQANLQEYWSYNNKLFSDHPYVLKYYGEPVDIDLAVRALVDEKLSEIYGSEIFSLREERKAMSDSDWRDRREWSRLHPEVNESYDTEEQLYKTMTQQLSQLRQLSHTGASARIPEMQEDLSELNQRQRAVAKVVDQMGLVSTLPIEPTREWKEKYTLEEETLFITRDLIYDQVLQEYPDYYDQWKEYERVKNIFGEDAAKVYGKDSGYFDARSYETKLTAQNPITLAEMDDAEIEYAANTLMYEQIQTMWPNIDQTWEQYYSLQEGSKERKAFWKTHPELGAYQDFKEPAFIWFKDELLRARAKVRLGQGVE